MKIDVKNALLKVSELLKKAEIKGFQRESAMILAEVLGKTIEEVYAHPECKISDGNLEKALNFAEKRVNGMPMAYVLGEKEFFGLEFKVNSNVLIPRPETEMMVEEAIDWAKSFEKDENLLILDVGTGSGCIPISIVKNVQENVDFVAVDFSEEALEIAKENVELYGLSEKITLEKSDLLSSLDLDIFENKDILITANLPYLSREIYDETDSSVQDFEPEEALISGEDGLDHYRRLFDEIKLVISNLDNSGKDNWIPASAGMTRAKSLEILLEISPEQKELIENLIKEKFGDKMQVSVKKDLAGKYRLVKITRINQIFNIEN